MSDNSPRNNNGKSDEGEEVLKDPIHGVAYLIAISFVLVMGGTLIASVWNPHIDVGFIIQITISFMGFSSFLTLHFGQRRINQRVNIIPCLKDQEKIAERVAETKVEQTSRLEKKIEEVTDQQTVKLAEKIEEAADSVTRNSVNINRPKP